MEVCRMLTTGEELLPGEVIIIPFLSFLFWTGSLSPEQYIPSLSSTPQRYTVTELPELDPVITMMLIQMQ
jgi:hypothetical protein